MNRLKVAIQELKDHLGKDSHGVLLLDKVTKIANDQRTRCATLETAATTDKTTIASLRGNLGSLEGQTTALREELQREKAKRAAAEQRERELFKQAADRQEPEEPEDSAEAVTKDLRWQIAGLIKKVRRRYKRLPGGDLSGNNLFVEDYVKTFAYDEFAGLGMVAAMCALVGMSKKVTAEHTSRGFDEEWKEQNLRPFVQMIKKTLKPESEMDARMAAAERAGPAPPPGYRIPSRNEPRRY